MRATWHTLAQLAVVLLGCGCSSDGQELAGSGPEYNCPVWSTVDSAPMPRWRSDPTVRETYRGQNGVFTDKCEAGNLTQYMCERDVTQGPPGDPIEWTVASGDVESQTYDCAGHCVEGACPNLCPAVGDQFRYVVVGGVSATTFESLATGWTYACGLRGTAEGVDCTTTPMVGDVVNVTSILTTSCLNLVAFWTGTGTTPECDYSSCAVMIP